MVQIEVYDGYDLVAICDSFSSLLWDIEFYKPGEFEIYIAANATNLEHFQMGRIVKRTDDDEHFGLIEKVQITTDTENGDYLTVSGRFLVCLLERRIIYPTYSGNSSIITIAKNIIMTNAMTSKRAIPGLNFGAVNGWSDEMTLQVSYQNLMDWLYKICETIYGSVNLRVKGNAMFLDFLTGADRSIEQNANPHIVFSDSYNNLLSFDYASDNSVTQNVAYIFGEGEGSERKHTTYFDGTEPSGVERYEVYLDRRDTAQEELTDEEYLAKLKQIGAENMVSPQIASEAEIAPLSTQFEYNKDYFVGDFVTVQHDRFALSQNRIQLVGMIESFDQNGRSLTPTFKEV